MAEPFVTVTAGNVDFTATDNIGKYDEQANTSEAPITDYEIYNEYQYDYHIYGAGVTAPEGFAGSSLSLFQLCTPTLLWICRWTGCRFSQCPQYPDTTPNDNNWVLMDKIPQAPDITLAPDGVTPLYRFSGIYVYMHKNPSVNTYNNVNFARPPWIENTFNRTIPNAQKTKNLIDTNQQGGNGGVLNFPVA